MNADAKKLDPQLAIDEEIINIIDKAILETFNSFMGFTPVLKQIEKHHGTLNERYEISGIIAFVQETTEGTLAIRFKQNSIFKLLSKVYGEELVTLDSRVIGGVAELTNVIHGITKEELNSQGHCYQMCLPLVIVGENYSIINTFNGQKLIMKYDLEGEEAIIELLLYK